MGLQDRDWYREAVKEIMKNQSSKESSKNKFNFEKPTYEERNEYKYHFNKLPKTEKTPFTYLIWLIGFLFGMTYLFKHLGNF